MSMKKRAVSFLLAILTVQSLVLPALAADTDEILDETLEELPAEVPEVEEDIDSTILLDGEPVPTMEYEMRDGVCYVTVSSFGLRFCALLPGTAEPDCAPGVLPC